MKLKIYACSDIHDNFENFNPPSDVDLIFCAGDLTNYGLPEGFKAQTRSKIQGIDSDREILRMKAWLEKCGSIAPTYWLSGNHDKNIKDRNIGPKNVTNIFGLREKIPTGQTIVGMSLCYCPDHPKLVNVWDNMTANPNAEKAYYAQEKFKRAKIVLSHSPPTGITATDNKWGDIGSPSLRTYIIDNQPDIVICGHVHQPKARIEIIGKTIVYNIATVGEIIEYEPQAVSPRSY